MQAFSLPIEKKKRKVDEPEELKDFFEPIPERQRPLSSVSEKSDKNASPPVEEEKLQDQHLNEPPNNLPPVNWMGYPPAFYAMPFPYNYATILPTSQLPSANIRPLNPRFPPASASDVLPFSIPKTKK